MMWILEKTVARYAAWVVSLVMGSGLFPVGSGAQGFFVPHAGKTHYEQYSTVWDCVSASQRVRDSARYADSVLYDTLPMVDGEARLRFPAEAVRVAQLCGKSLPAADTKSFLPWLTLLLLRDDSAGAEALVQREVLERKYDDPEQVIPVVMSMLDVYRENSDRSNLALPTVSKIVEQLVPVPEHQVRIWGEYLRGARERGDKQLIELVGGKIVALVDKLGSDRMADGGDVRAAIASGIRARFERELLDTLRQSGTAAWRRFWYAIHEQAEKQGWLFGWQRGIGEEAPSIEPAKWLPERPGEAIPRLGKVSLLIFLDGNSYMLSALARNVEDFNFFATVRRLKKQFPELDITVVSRTLGWFGHGPPVTVQEEADIVERWLIKKRNLPVRLGIDNTPWYRLPDPDRRRVNSASDIDRNYFLGVAGSSLSDALRSRPVAVLVSRDRMVIKRGEIRRQSEQDFATLIEVLLNVPTEQK